MGELSCTNWKAIMLLESHQTADMGDVTTHKRVHYLYTKYFILQHRPSPSAIAHSGCYCEWIQLQALARKIK
eukprot:6173288-Pleurochrysis_carterae.AAC.1